MNPKVYFIEWEATGMTQRTREGIEAALEKTIHGESEMIVEEKLWDPKDQFIPLKQYPNSKAVGASIPVTEDCSMTVTASGPITQKGIEKLVAYLNLVKGSFPSNVEQ